MRLCYNNVEMIPETVSNVEKIERCARICYKSEDKGDRKQFLRKLAGNGHFSVFEHSNIILKVKRNFYKKIKKLAPKYLVLTKYYERHIVSGSMRAWKEFITENRFLMYNVFDGKNSVRLNESDLVPIELKYHLRLTFIVTCDRGISHELVRHRKMSFSQESTRYCNYEKKGIEFIVPETMRENISVKNEFVTGNMIVPHMTGKAVTWYLILAECERSYLSLLSKGCKPQEARSVLPNSLKTIIAITANITDWFHFLDLRYYQNTGKVHPDMLIIASMIYNKIMETYPCLNGKNLK